MIFAEPRARPRRERAATGAPLPGRAAAEAAPGPAPPSPPRRRRGERRDGTAPPARANAIGTNARLTTSTMRFRSSASRASAARGAHALHRRDRTDPDRQRGDEQARRGRSATRGSTQDQDRHPQRDQDQDREQVADQLRRPPPEPRCRPAPARGARSPVVNAASGISTASRTGNTSWMMALMIPIWGRAAGSGCRSRADLARRKAAADLPDRIAATTGW